MTKNKLVVVRKMPGLIIKVVAERCDRLELWICNCYVNEEPFDQRQSEDAFETAKSMILSATIENEDKLARTTAGTMNILAALAAAVAAPGMMLAAHACGIFHSMTGSLVA